MSDNMICPYCEKKLNEGWFNRLKQGDKQFISEFGQGHVYHLKCLFNKLDDDRNRRNRESDMQLFGVSMN